MELERELHMVPGDGETSYAKNSRLQREEKALLEVRPMLEKAVTEVCMTLSPRTMVVADLGCSSGPNALLFVSGVAAMVEDHCKRSGHRPPPPELHFFLNDLPSNDFNHLFRSLERFKKLPIDSESECKHGGEMVAAPPQYIVGLPGSFYTRLFPSQSVHLFHSCYSLMWLSQLPAELQVSSKLHPNEGNIYITKNTPPLVVRMYQEQFKKDLSMFLELRAKELVFGGQMLLTFLGRKNDDVFDGDLNHLCGLLGQAMQSLVAEGIVEKKSLDSFNLPIYGPSIEEVTTVVSQSSLFEISHIRLFNLNWDPYDDSTSDLVGNIVQSGVNVARCLRAVAEPLLASHFGECILDELFKRYACNVSKHLEREKTKFSVIVVSLKCKP
ncbi:hypothetical protein ACP4OV_017433 [Aristida adscensionis]